MSPSATKATRQTRTTREVLAPLDVPAKAPHTAPATITAHRPHTVAASPRTTRWVWWFTRCPPGVAALLGPTARDEAPRVVRGAAPGTGPSGAERSGDTGRRPVAARPRRRSSGERRERRSVPMQWFSTGSAEKWSPSSERRGGGRIVAGGGHQDRHETSSGLPGNVQGGAAGSSPTHSPTSGTRPRLGRPTGRHPMSSRDLRSVRNQPSARSAVDEHELDEHDRGLSHDLPAILDRRRALTLFSVAGIATLAGCSAASSSSTVTAAATPATSTTPSSSTSTSASASGTVYTDEIPEETGGPFPADGSNGVNVLTESGVVRSDITTSFGSAAGVAEGVPLTIRLTVLDTSNGSAPLAGAAVYLWHCDRDGRYSLYADAIQDENYLRGVQEADSSGVRRVHLDLPRGLLRAVAAHPLRDLPEPHSGHLGERQDAHDPAGAARGRLRRRLRHHGLRAERPQPGADLAVAGHGLQRRLLAAAGHHDRVGRRGATPRR